MKPPREKKTTLRTPHSALPPVIPAEGMLLDVPASAAPPDVDELWTISTFHRMTGVDRRTIEDRFTEAKIYPAKTVQNRNKHESGLYRPPEGLRAIYVNTPNAASRLKDAQAKKIERENAKQEGIDAGELMRTDDVIKLMTTGIKQLQNIRDWARNENNLTPDTIQARVDETLSLWAGDIRFMGQPKIVEQAQ